jgi:amino acid adenylation domain-containing protein
MDLVQRISKLSPEQKRLLESKIKQQDVDIFHIPISREYRKNYQGVPLSFEQEPMWFMEQLEPHNSTYDIICAIRLEGNLDKDVLGNSIDAIVNRHDILRTRFIMENHKPTQVILPELNLELKIIDLSGWAGREQEHKIKEFREDKSLHMFDLSKGPLLRSVLLDLGENNYIFFTIMHHIISDIISTKIFMEELTWFYRSFSQGDQQDPDLPGVSCQYADYACWQRRWFEESTIGIETRKKQEKFWLNQFKDEVPVLSLPTDYPRPAHKSREAGRVMFLLNEEEVRDLKEMALKENTTLYFLVLAILYVFLAKISGQEDIVVGTPISSRKQDVLNHTIGMFTRTLALRNYPRGHKIFRDFLSEVNTQTLEMFENQEYQYEELVGKVLVKRDPGHNPLFDVIYNFSYLDTGEITMPGLKMQPLRWNNERTSFDIDFCVEGTYKELFFKFAYSTILFKEATIKRFISYFRRIMDTVSKAPDIKISEIQVMPAAEKERLLHDFNNTKKNLVRDKSCALLFEEEVVKRPGKIAAVYREHQITYNELNEEASRMAARLSRQGAAFNTIVYLYLKRSIKMLAAIIGIFKAGAAYLPIDIDYPGTRIRFILENSEAQTTVTDTDHVEILKRLQAPLSPLKEIICLDHEKKTGSMGRCDSFRQSQGESLPDSLAYVIYTSGTMGKPKGVMIHQLGMINHLYAKINDLSITVVDIIAQTASACFDISVWQFLAGIMRGGTVVIIDKEVLLDSLRFLGVLQQMGITILEFVPSLMMAFLEAAAQGDENALKFKSLKHLRWMISTGEPLTPQLVNQWYRHYPHITLVNAYGPTEAADDITHYIVPSPPAETQTTVPIGKPLQNLHIYILDKYLSLCPIGVRGEICVAGVGVGKGYLNNPELTFEKFDHDSWDLQDYHDGYHRSYRSYKSYVLYKTGDIGYFREDGHIECLGRMDSQVKIRGNRVELEEIENQLESHEEIKKAVVTVSTTFKTGKPGEPANRYLCAYIVFHHEIPVSELKKYLEERLPHYMVPSYFIPLEKTPLTANGKIDRRALPEPVYENDETGKEYIAPTNEVEVKLAEIWSELLGIEKETISIDANFFELGGHSLKTPVMLSRIRKEFNVSVPLVEVFKTPNIRELSASLQRIK